MKPGQTKHDQVVERMIKERKEYYDRKKGQHKARVITAINLQKDAQMILDGNLYVQAKIVHELNIATYIKYPKLKEIFNPDRRLLGLLVLRFGYENMFIYTSSMIRCMRLQYKEDKNHLMGIMPQLVKHGLACYEHHKHGQKYWLTEEAKEMGKFIKEEYDRLMAFAFPAVQNEYNATGDLKYAANRRANKKWTASLVNMKSREE